MNDVPEEKLEGESAPVIEHIRELRNRLLIVVLTMVVGMLLCYSFAPQIYQFLVQPLQDVYEGQEGKRLIFTGLTEAFFTYLKLAFFGGFILGFPVIAYQLYAFVAPGLYKNERKVLKPFLLGAPALFLLGAAMAYYAIFPLAWRFFVGFEMGGAEGAMPIELEARVGEYLALSMRLIIAFGLAFQLPVLLMLLALTGIITAAGLRNKRKYAIVGMFAFAAVITPPDVISQIGLAIPLLFLYEISVYMTAQLEKKRAGARDELAE